MLKSTRSMALRCSSRLPCAVRAPQHLASTGRRSCSPLAPAAARLVVVRAATPASEPESSKPVEASVVPPESERWPPPPPPPPPPVVPPPVVDEPPSSASFSLDPTTSETKAALMDSVFGTERGLSARSELRAEINELISQLEAKNPTPSPTEAINELDGTWKLIYTSNSLLLTVMALGKLPLVTVGDFTQRIDSITSTVENKVELSGPLSKTELTATARFEVRSPKRLQLQLTEGKVATPELLADDLDLPGSITVMGQFVDLTQLKDALGPLKDQAVGVITQLNQLVSQVPDLAIPIQSDEAQTWQLTTYVDEDLRVARGDGGAVFIYSRL